MGYLLLRYLTDRDKSERENKILIKNNDKCRDLISERNWAMRKGEPALTYEELNKRLNQILKQPGEIENALENMRKHENSESQSKQWRRDKRKIGYKYEIEIFEIFNTDREVTKEYVIERAQAKFNTTPEKAIALFDLWQVNQLVQQCHWDKDKWEVGTILSDTFYSLDENDLTQSKWLLANNKKLKPVSEAYKKYVDNID